MKNVNKYILPLLYLLSFTLFIISFVLCISEFNTIKLYAAFTQIKFILPIRYSSYLIFIISSLYCCYNIFIYKHILRENIKSAIVKIIAGISIISLLLTILIPLFSYNQHEEYNDIFGNEKYVSDEYVKFFPCNEKIINNSKSNETIYSYGEYKIFSSKYVHIQNSSADMENSAVYDVEFFSSNDKVMMFQYLSEKLTGNNRVVCKSGNLTYTLVEEDDCTEIIIKDENVYFSLYVSDFDDVISNKDELVNIAINQYNYLKN